MPIAHGQTISQPFWRSCPLARPSRGWPRSRVLEVGTGSGCRAAVLAELGASVVSVERQPELSAQAAENLLTAGYTDVLTEIGDGSQGWAAGAPYDAILVTAAGPSVPDPPRGQMSRDGGRRVLPSVTVRIVADRGRARR